MKKPEWSLEKKGRSCLCVFYFLLILSPLSVDKAFCRNEIITVPIVLADYYGWAYTEAFMDRSDVYGWTTAGLDALGWGIILTRKEYSGLFLVNMAGIAKTIYPAAELLASSDSNVRKRAWIALATHTATLLSLDLLGKPALGIQAWEPSRGGYGAKLAFEF